MLLLVDAGNSRIKWAVLEEHASSCARLGQWLHSGSSTHQDLAQTANAWKTFPISDVLISNVAGSEMQGRLLEATAEITSHITWFSSTAHCAGIRNDYRNPAQLGSDRFASAIAAHTLFPKHMLIVVTAGTATTIDAINPAGHFTGGMILPGLGLMAKTLALNTAQLPQVGEPLANTQPFADNTADAILSGCLTAQVGAIEHAAGLLFAMGKKNVKCVLSGGAASFIAPHLSVSHERIENLVLIGLQIVSKEKLLC